MSLPTQMNLIEATGAGGPEVLKLTQGPVPQPEAQDVLIRVAAAGSTGPMSCSAWVVILSHPTPVPLSAWRLPAKSLQSAPRSRMEAGG